MLVDYLKENNLIITSNKKKVVKEMNKTNSLIQYKVMTKKEFLDNYCFSYDKKTIKYLIEKENISVEIALEYLNYLVYLEDKDYKNDKLNKLVSIKKDLLDKELLCTNQLFKSSLSNTNIILYDCDVDPFIKKILDK